MPENPKKLTKSVNFSAKKRQLNELIIPAESADRYQSVAQVADLNYNYMK
jgi:hypothetical protein